MHACACCNCAHACMHAWSRMPHQTHVLMPALALGGWDAVGDCCTLTPLPYPTHSSQPGVLWPKSAVVWRGVRRLLAQALEHATASMAHYRHTHTLGKTEAPLFRAASRAMLEVVLPYLAGAFARIFPPATARLDTASSAMQLRQLLSDL